MSDVQFCEYEVTGKREYRGHKTGTVFQARHDPAKQRGINRGDIRLIRICEPGVPEERTYPNGWLPPPERAAPQANPEAAEAASLMHEGG